MKSSLYGLAAVALLLQGCHIYQPMISQQVPAKDIDDLDWRECISDPVGSTALRRACLKLRDIESARSQHQILIGASGNALIPAASYVTYRVARDASSATTTGWALGGLAGYATVGFLAPDGRVEAYTRGSEAMSCALGVYAIAAASVPRAILQRGEYEKQLKKAEVDLKKAGDKADPDDLEQIKWIKSAVYSASSTTLLDAQLDKFVYRTVEDLNKLLRGTLPTLADLTSDIAALSNIVAPAAQGDARIADNADELKPLRDAANALISAESTQRASADFTPCSMSMGALTAQGIYKPFALGPGNSMDNRTVPLSKDSQLAVPIIGGLAPFGFNVAGSHAASRPEVQITMQGVVLLTVTVKGQDSAAEQTHTISIFDSAGASRSLKVVVPKGS
jgi:hypothetical protein